MRRLHLHPCEVDINPILPVLWLDVMIFDETPISPSSSLFRISASLGENLNWFIQTENRSDRSFQNADGTKSGDSRVI